jgi:hypothetical protein
VRRVPVTLGGALPRHFYGHLEQDLTLAVVQPGEKFSKSAQFAVFLASRAPLSFRFGSREVGFLRRLVSLVEQFVDRNLNCPRVLFKRLDGGNGVAVFYTGGIAPKQARSFFNVALTEVLFFAELPKSFADDHRFGTLHNNVSLINGILLKLKQMFRLCRCWRADRDVAGSEVG